MHLNFDGKPVKPDDKVVHDQSGNTNDADLANGAEISNRTMGMGIQSNVNFVKTVSDSSAERKTEEAIGRIVPVDSLGLLPFACPLCATGAQRFLTEPAIV